MNTCSRCERSFKYKNSLRRHQQKRRYPCRPAVTSCAQCGNTFTNLESLKKHKRLYCKYYNHDISLQEFLDQFNSPDDDVTSVNVGSNSPARLQNFIRELHTPQPSLEDDDYDDVKPVSKNNPFFDNDSFQELLNHIQFSPMMSTNNEQDNNPDKSTTTAAAAAAATVTADNDEILTPWLCEVQRLEDVCKSNTVVKDKIHESLHRMLQDGLVSATEYNDLIYTTNLFIRLHNLIAMYIPSQHKRSVIELITELYEMKKITKHVLIELCVNL